MTFAPVSLHVGAGGVVLLLYWAVLLYRKGSRPHQWLGRLFLLSLLAVLATVGAILFLGASAFAIPDVIQFSYLWLCLVTVGLTGFLAIRLKRDLERFRGLWFRMLGGATFLSGAVVLAAGIATRDPVPMVFSIIGLLFGGAMLRFAFLPGPVHPRWPLIWHLNAMCLLFNAVHGNVLAVLWRAGADLSGGREVLVATELGTMLAALVLRLWFGRRYEAPLRLGPKRAPRLPDMGMAASHDGRAVRTRRPTWSSLCIPLGDSPRRTDLPLAAAAPDAALAPWAPPAVTLAARKLRDRPPCA